MPKRRTAKEVVEAIFETLAIKGKMFKSDFEAELGLNNKSVTEWMDIIQYVQQSPSIERVEHGRITIYKLKEEEKE